MRGVSVPRRWGWHRLDRSCASRIVAEAPVSPGDLVLDVGAGDGVLCEALLHRGARVVALELHPDRVRVLRRRFAGRGVRVVVADASDLRLPRRPFSVVANPPFATSMALVRRLVAPGSRLVWADIVVPRHVARRWCRGSAGGAERWGIEFEMSMGRRVPGSSFRPAVGRDAVVLRIRRVGGSPERGRSGSPERAGLGRRSAQVVAPPNPRWTRQSGAASARRWGDAGVAGNPTSTDW